MARSVKFATRVWWKRPGRIAIAGKGFISTVSNDPSSKRFHPNLYKKLEKVLSDCAVPPPARLG